MLPTLTRPDSFYQCGGDLPSKSPSYIARRHDKDLYDGLIGGEFCYVLTSRQMGKSSLARRIKQRLRSEGVTVAWLDLAGVGGPGVRDAEQWFGTLLMYLGQELDLEDDLDDFWKKHRDLSPLYRWREAIRQVVLVQRPGPVVVFIDEIENVRNLGFSTDEFFASIRACYNHRADDPELRRLTFCLVGTATPSELIDDPLTTPFNIGRRIELEDFTQEEAAGLAKGLKARRADRQPADGAASISGRGASPTSPRNSATRSPPALPKSSTLTALTACAKKCSSPSGAPRATTSTSRTWASTCCLTTNPSAPHCWTSTPRSVAANGFEMTRRVICLAHCGSRGLCGLIAATCGSAIASTTASSTAPGSGTICPMPKPAASAPRSGALRGGWA